MPDVYLEPVQGWPTWADFPCTRCGGRLLLEEVERLDEYGPDDQVRTDYLLWFCCEGCGFRPCIRQSMIPSFKPKTH